MSIIITTRYDILAVTSYKFALTIALSLAVARDRVDMHGYVNVNLQVTVTPESHSISLSQIKTQIVFGFKKLKIKKPNRKIIFIKTLNNSSIPENLSPVD